MTKKSKGAVILDSSPLHGAGVDWDARTRFKHQSLMQDYAELQKGAALMKSKLEMSKQRKSVLAAEVRFLRRRYKLLMQAKTVNSSREPGNVQPPNLLKRNKAVKEGTSSRKEASLLLPRLPSIPELQPKKKSYFRKAVGRIKVPKETSSRNKIPFLDLRPNDESSRNPVGIFDLNHRDCFPNGKESYLPSRAPVFDLNEISTEEEEFQTGNDPIMFEEGKRNLFIGGDDELQNELKISICRNAGEGPSHVGKRKISWLDPVALRV